MSTAFALTSQPNWRDKYAITVYQMGWRLGGKGASGRNADEHQRIEEHGLHAWGGFYQNAFRVMHECYTEWEAGPLNPKGVDRAGETNPMAWSAAFKPKNVSTVQEHIDGEWITWAIDMPANDAIPGDDSPLPRPWEQALRVFDRMVFALEDCPAVRTTPREAHSTFDRVGDWAWDVLGRRLLFRQLRAIHGVLNQVPVEWFGMDTRPHDALMRVLTKVLKQFDKLKRRLWRRLGPHVHSHDVARRMWIHVDLITTVLRGAIVDEVLWRGVDHLDGEDWRAWLRRHGALESPTVESGGISAAYDYVFAYLGGDPTKPALAAGTALQVLSKLLYGYKGAVFWEMQAGMGDTVFTPFYDVLKARGVEFKFFHRADALELTADTSNVARIRMTRQADLRDPAHGYDPFVMVKGIKCWPSTPLYDQLVQGDELREQHIHLEDQDAHWPGVGEVVLERGRDFDTVILGISLGVVPGVCQELLAARAQWQNMVEHVQTVRTLAMQLWFNRSPEAMGWKIPATIMAGYAEPFNAWAGFGHLISVEDWPEDMTPRSLSYFCGPMPDGEADDTWAKHRAIAWLKENGGHLWPDATPPGNTHALDFSVLMAPENHVGDQRFDSQYCHAHETPSDRYVLSVPGSLQHRLRAGEAGFDNLYLAGDWVRTGLNAGCVECAVMAGMQASRAISGWPEKVAGETPWDV